MARRRGHNEGSIYQRASDGKWLAVLTVRTPAGKRKRVTRVRATRKEAAKALRELQRQQDDGFQLGAEDPLVRVYLRRWLATARRSLGPKTGIDYQAVIEQRLIPALGRHKLSQLRTEHIDALYSDLAAQGLAPGTIALTHAVLRRALNQAVKRQRLLRNPCDAVDVPRPEQSEMKTLTREEVETFFAHTAGDPHHALYVLALTTGMRQGELLGLFWSDIDFAAPEGRPRLHVRRALKYLPREGYRFGEPKTDRSRRTIHLSRRAVQALRHHRREQLERRLLLGAEWGGALGAGGWAPPGHGVAGPELVFPTATGQPLNGSYVTRRFKAELARAGLPVVRFHDLRHTAATLLLLANVHVKIVSEMLGHASIAMTLDRYSHVIPAMHQQAADVMDQLFGIDPDAFADQVAD